MTESRLYSEITDRIKQIKENVAEAVLASGRAISDVEIMAVTKTVPAEIVNIAVESGIKLLGENRAQELLEKHEFYDKSAQIHFIGALQTNKVKQIIDKVSMIQSVDRISLAEEIQKQCVKINKTIDVLIEVNIGNEMSKSGIMSEDLRGFIDQISKFDRLKVRGLMAIPPANAERSKSESYFDAMREIFIDIKAEKLDNVRMDILSMGMSGDYMNAIRQGSNLVRLGTAIFGKRV